MMKRVGSDVRRAFSVAFGLQEGYAQGARVHSFEEATMALKEWMVRRAASGKDFLTGTLSAGEVVYAWPDGPGKAGSGSEPCAVFAGEVSVLYAAHLSDQVAEEILDDLASEVGRALGQTRVYVSYLDMTWVLQTEQTQTPTGETV